MDRENVKKLLLAAAVCMMLLVALNYQFGIFDAILEKVTQDFVRGSQRLWTRLKSVNF